MLADAPLQEQKQMLGERLFPLIRAMYSDLAGKITGMLLEIDNAELLHMLEHHESLKSKVSQSFLIGRNEKQLSDILNNNIQITANCLQKHLFLLLGGGSRCCAPSTSS